MAAGASGVAGSTGGADAAGATGSGGVAGVSSSPVVPPAPGLARRRRFGRRFRRDLGRILGRRFRGRFGWTLRGLRLPATRPEQPASAAPSGHCPRLTCCGPLGRMRGNAILDQRSPHGQGFRSAKSMFHVKHLAADVPRLAARSRVRDDGVRQWLSDPSLPCVLATYSRLRTFSVFQGTRLPNPFPHTITQAPAASPFARFSVDPRKPRIETTGESSRKPSRTKPICRGGSDLSRKAGTVGDPLAAFPRPSTRISASAHPDTRDWQTASPPHSRATQPTRLSSGQPPGTQNPDPNADQMPTEMTSPQPAAERAQPESATSHPKDPRKRTRSRAACVSAERVLAPPPRDASVERRCIQLDPEDNSRDSATTTANPQLTNPPETLTQLLTQSGQPRGAEDPQPRGRADASPPSEF